MKQKKQKIDEVLKKSGFRKFQSDRVASSNYYCSYHFSMHHIHFRKPYTVVASTNGNSEFVCDKCGFAFRISK